MIDHVFDVRVIRGRGRSVYMWRTPVFVPQGQTYTLKFTNGQELTGISQMSRGYVGITDRGTLVSEDDQDVVWDFEERGHRKDIKLWWLVLISWALGLFAASVALYRYPTWGNVPLVVIALFAMLNARHQLRRSKARFLKWKLTR